MKRRIAASLRGRDGWAFLGTAVAIAAVVAMLFLPVMRIGGMQFFRSEGFDTLGKIMPRAGQIASEITRIYILLTIACMNDIIAFKFHISLNATTWIGRIGMVILPAVVYYIAYRWAIGLQRSDRAVLEQRLQPTDPE